MLESFSLSVINRTEPTYHYRRNNQFLSSLLDLVITSTPKITFLNQISLGCLDGHDFLYFVYDMNVTPIQQTKYIRDYSKINYNDLSNFISNQSWYEIYCTADIDNQVEHFNNLVNVAYEKFVPLKAIYLKSNRCKPSWFTDELDIQINIREFLYRRSKLLGNTESSNAYRKHRNFVTKLIRSLRVNYLKEQLNDSLPPKQFWKNVNDLGMGNQVDNHVNLPYTAEEFANFYKSVGSGAPDNLESPTVTDGFAFRNVTMTELQSSFYSIKSNSIGLDGISNKFLRIIFPILQNHFLYIVNCMLTKSVFPSAWKLAKIIPIPKISKPKEISDFRPISILPMLSKAFEKLIKDQILDYLHKDNLLDKCQSAYRPHHNTESAVLHIVDDIRRSLDKSKECILVSFDFTKAFDNINQSTLLRKLSSQFKFSSNACNLISSYLSDRSQVICANSAFSAKFTLYRGVPQGSVLGPLLFSLYINDLPNSIIHSKYHLFADDLQIYFETSMDTISDDIASINTDIEGISKWAFNNFLTLNNNKTQAIVIHRRPIDTSLLPPLKIGSNIVMYSDKIKTLGIVIEHNLSWSCHLDLVCGRIRFMLRRLWTLTGGIDQEVKKKLFFAYIFPHFLYGCTVLYGMQEYNFNKLQLVFNACTRYIFNLRKFDHISSYNIRVLPISLREYYNFRICSVIYKILKFQEPLYLMDKLQRLSSSRLQNILVVSNKTDILNSSFFVRGIRIWNELPSSIKNSTSIACFRKSYFQFKM